MIVLSLVLVIIAAVTLVLGVFQDGLTFIYVSIGTCLAAMVLLGIGVLMRRREESEAAPASPGYGTRPESAAGAGSPPAPQDDAVQVRKATDTQQMPETREQRPAVDTGEVRPAKKAVVKKVSAGSESGAERSTRPFEGRPATAEHEDRDSAEAPAAATVASGATAASGAAAKKVVAKKSGTKKATAKKAAAKKTAKKAAKKSTAKKSTTKKAATKKGTAKKTTKKASASAQSLPDIKGLGPSKANALLERFGSVEGIRDADLSDISDIKGIGDGLARQLKRELGG